MKQRLFTFLVACFACVGILNASEQIGDLFYNFSSNWDGEKYVYTASVTYQYSSSHDNYLGLTAAVIPEKVTYNNVEYTVTSIGSYAFYYCDNLTSVTIPATVTAIDNYAFYACNNLTSVHISDIEAWCKISFNSSNPVTYAQKLYLNGKLLTHLEIPEGITEIKQNAFRNCQSLTSVSIPNSVTSIGQAAFYNCDGLTSVVLPDGLTTLGGEAFFECDKLTSIIIPDGVTTLGSSAFYSCDRLESVTLGNSITNIGSNAFAYCRNLSLIEIPNSVTNIGSEAFRDCDALKSVTFGEQVSIIGNSAFYSCDNLSSLVIPNSVTVIGNSAFSSCGRLNAVTIGNNAISFGNNAFSYCPIATINFTGSIADWCTKPWSPNVLSNSYDLWIDNKPLTAIVIPDGVTTIGDNAFAGCNGLNSIDIPSSVTSIGVNTTIPVWNFAGDSPAEILSNSFASDVCLIVNDAATYKAAWPEYESRIFQRNIAIQELNVVARSDKSALHILIGEENLENVINLTLKGTINSYDLMIIRNKMINLRSLDIRDANIEANSYEYYTGFCTHADTLLDHSFKNLVSLRLPKTLKYVADAVSECPNLQNLEINAGIVDGKMVPSTNLAVVLNEGVTSIGSSAFSYTGGLKSITLPASLGTIGANSFCCSYGLQFVTIAEGITAIGDYAFSGTSLVEVTIPASVTRIGNHAFAPYNGNYNGNGSYLYTYVYSQNCHWEDYYNEEYGYWDSKYICEDSGEISSNRNYASYGRTLGKLRFAEGSQLQSIGERSFLCCPIDTLILPETVSSIGEYAFAWCTDLKYVYLPDNENFTAIPQGAFQQCGAINSLHLPADLQTVGTLSFSVHSGTPYGELELVLPEKVSQIGRGAFYGRGSNLKRAVFPNSLKSIEQQAFYGCTGLETLSFPTSLQTIGNQAFYGCSNLQEVRVPSTLRSVGDYAFAECSNVTKVYTYTVEPVSIDQNTFSCWHNADLYVPTTSYYTYFYNTQWSQFLSLKQFDEEYEYFYINNDYELGGENGTIDGTPDADLNENSGLIVSGDDEQQVGTITVAGDENGAASIIACEGNLSAETLVINIVTKKGNWSYFCFPFDLLLDQLHFAHQYVIREYDGATRAQYGAGGWINMVGDMLQKGLGYIFQGAETDTLTITIPNPKISCEDYEQLIQAFSASDNTHANWNFIGNPYPSWYDLNALFEYGFESPIYIWNSLINDYKVFRPGDDEYHLHPYEGFFTQNPEGRDILLRWSSAGRETKTQADQKRNNIAPRRMARMNRQASQQRHLINLVLASDTYNDRTRVVFNDAASADYELGRDAVVMDGGQAPLHIWSISPKNARLAINERPFATGQVALGYDVKEDGFYTLSASRMDTAVIIYDNELRQEVDLSLGDYMFFSEAGTNTTRFAIVGVKTSTQTVTDLENTTSDMNSRISVYTPLGVKLFDNVLRSDIRLDAGLYIIEDANGARSEVKID